MKQPQIDWAQFIGTLITVAAMAVAFPLLCVASVAFVVALLLSRLAALFSVIVDARMEGHGRRGRK